jgi:hypothetical protein
VTREIFMAGDRPDVGEVRGATCTPEIVTQQWSCCELVI